MYFSAENLLEVNTVVMNYKIRLLSSLLFVVAEKQKNMVWTCEATCKGSMGSH